MIEAFTIGPLLVPAWPAAVIVSLFIAVWGAGRLGDRANLDGRWLRAVAESAAWVGMLGARLSYVAANWDAFRPEPWTALYFWQPGYLPSAGIVLGAVWAIWRLRRKLAPDRWLHLQALGTAYVGGAAAFGAFALALHLLAPPGLLGSGDRVPDFTLVDLDGNTVRFSNLEGQGVVLNFWATWCPPCRREMPLLDAIQTEYAPRGLAVIGIDLEEPVDVVARFVAQMGVDYPIWLDPGPARAGHDSTRAVYQHFGGIGLPTTIFVGRDGIVRDIHVGELNRAILRERAEQILRR